MTGPGVEDVRRAARAGAGVVRVTPVLTSRTLSERCGGRVVLKAENLQRTGSFKLRGALAKLAALGERAAAGVVCASAGNHAQSVAYAARVRKVPCEVFIPYGAPLAKVAAAAGAGAVVHRHGDCLEDCIEAAHARADDGLVFVHPYDDPDVVAGQGTLGLELLDQVEDLAKVVIPVGGGGLAAGSALAMKASRPSVEVVGVEVTGEAGATIADGIAIKRPGELTRVLLEEWVDGTVVVDDDAIAAAMVFLLERAKLVVEGAGAVGVAALLGGQVAPAAEGTTVVVLSGGNVDSGLLGEVVRHHETEAGRRLVVLSRVSDRPGSLARLLALVGEEGANLIEVGHVREGVPLHVRETGVQLVLETRGREHAELVLRAIGAAGYEARRL